VLKENPFYVESGGQVSDTGAVAGEGWSLAVDSVRKDSKGTVIGGTFSQEFEQGFIHKIRYCSARLLHHRAPSKQADD
jgi:alanyl-tRNA synthetase